MAHNGDGGKDTNTTERFITCSVSGENEVLEAATNPNN
jgi:hypothetical protein